MREISRPCIILYSPPFNEEPRIREILRDLLKVKPPLRDRPEQANLCSFHCSPVSEGQWPASLFSVFDVALRCCASEHESINGSERPMASGSRRDCVIKFALNRWPCCPPFVPWLLRGLWLLGLVGLVGCATVPQGTPLAHQLTSLLTETQPCVFPNLLQPDVLTIVILQFSPKDNTLITRRKLTE